MGFFPFPRSPHFLGCAKRSPFKKSPRLFVYRAKPPFAFPPGLDFDFNFNFNFASVFSTQPFEIIHFTWFSSGFLVVIEWFSSGLLMAFGWLFGGQPMALRWQKTIFGIHLKIEKKPGSNQVNDNNLYFTAAIKPQKELQYEIKTH